MRTIECHITPDGDGYYPEDRCEEVREKLYWELLSQEKERNPLLHSLRLLDRETWPLDLTDPITKPSMYVVVERSIERDWAVQLATGASGPELVSGTLREVEVGGIRFVTGVPLAEIADRMAWLQEFEDDQYRQVPFERRDPLQRIRTAIRYYERTPTSKTSRKRLPLLRFNLEEAEADPSYVTTDRGSK